MWTFVVLAAIECVLNISAGAVGAAVLDAIPVASGLCALLMKDKIQARVAHFYVWIALSVATAAFAIWVLIFGTNWVREMCLQL